MTRLSRGAALVAAATLVIAVALAEEVFARRGGGGFRGGGISRGPAARGSFAGYGRSRDMEYGQRGPAADGSLGLEYGDPGDRVERRQERREERREDWEDYDGDYEGYYYDDYPYYEEYDAYEDEYEEEETGVVYFRLPCKSNTMVLEGNTYYVCDSIWYARAFIDGELVYVEVPNPTSD